MISNLNETTFKVPNTFYTKNDTFVYLGFDYYLAITLQMANFLVPTFYRINS